MKKLKKLFQKDSVFTSEATDRVELFTEIYEKLRIQGLVTGDFLNQVIAREENFPTGLSSKNLGPDLPNIAVPHTEGQFVNEQLIVPVKLLNTVQFKSMVNPEQNLDVGFIFMILDTKPDGQAELLAKIMNFLGKASEEQLRTLLNLTDPVAIYYFLEENFA